MGMGKGEGDGKRGKGMGLGSLGLWSLWLGAGFGSLGLGVWGLGLWAWEHHQINCAARWRKKIEMKNIHANQFLDLRTSTWRGVVLIGELCCGVSLMRKSHEMATQKCVDKYRPINSFQHLPHTAAAGNFLYFCSNIEKN